MKEFAIKTKGLVKRFGRSVAVNKLDLDIPCGIFYGLLGPNGAGKSTTISMLTGILSPSAGKIEVFGKPLCPDDPTFKANMGVVTEEPSLFERLRGREQLVFTGRMYNLGRRESARRTDDLLDLLDLSSNSSTFIADYSRGMCKKLAIACALIHAPRLLFLDEPFEGIDATSTQTIHQVLTGLTRRKTTVLLTTHILEVAEKICDRVGILHQGQLMLETNVKELLARRETLASVFFSVVGKQSKHPLPAWLVGNNDND